LEADRAQEMDILLAEKTGNRDWGVKIKKIVCQSCGGESVYDAMQSSGECPYCGSNQVMEQESEDTLAPGGVCVFKIDQAQAGSNFTSWIKRKLFCPKAAKQKARPEAFKGVYLPYWTFDAQTDSTYTARYGIERTVRDKDGKTHTRVDWYRTSGAYSEWINDQLVCGTQRYDAGMLSSIEPFDTEDNLAYKPEYLSGFASERYSRGLSDAWEWGKKLILNHLESQVSSKVRSEHHADRVDSVRLNTAFSQVTYKYLMLPVYLSSFKYKNKVYQFMVNGQTGRVGGKSPVSALRVTVAVLIGLAVLALLWALINYFG
jgi:predicted RNA-binding Zn-ribbon protein involved in translation (DUF1610 family)